MNLVIDPEFRNLIPPLSADEHAELEASLLAEGCRDALVAWNGVLLDGHNRYALCQQHGLPFEVTERAFESRAAARAWIIRTQLGRRNLGAYARGALALQLKDDVALLARENQRGTQFGSPVRQNSDEPATPISTKHELAREAGLSHDTIHKVDIIERTAPEAVKAAARSADISIHRAYQLTRALEQLPDADRGRAAVLCLDHDEKARIMVRLHQSSHHPESNGTYGEILSTGGFHYGDECEQWLDFQTSGVESITKALQSLARHHAREAMQNRDEDDEAARMRPHVTHNTGEQEWYTPPEILAVARAVMGDIDLDPASSDEANRLVRATHYYTARDNGLAQPWRGRVWMNPPYAQPLVAQFSERLVQAWQSGEVSEACVLVNNATETRWFQGLLAVAAAVCFIHGRVRFIDVHGEPGGAPLQGQALLYAGPNPNAFTRASRALGMVLYVP